MSSSTWPTSPMASGWRVLSAEKKSEPAFVRLRIALKFIPRISSIEILAVIDK
jgi:hypothetical protein